MTEPLTPAAHLSPAQRAAEITQILAAALLRYPANRECFGLGLLPDQRGNGAPHPTERLS
jgi:hypothetical protein